MPKGYALRPLLLAGGMAVALAVSPPAARAQQFDAETWLAETLQALFTGGEVDADEMAAILGQHFSPQIQDWVIGLVGAMAAREGQQLGFVLVRDPDTGALSWIDTANIPLDDAGIGGPSADDTDTAQDTLREFAERLDDQIGDPVVRTVACTDVCGFFAAQSVRWRLLPPSLGFSLIRSGGLEEVGADDFGLDPEETATLLDLLAGDELVMLGVHVEQLDETFVRILRRDVLVASDYEQTWFAGGNQLTSPDRMLQLGVLGVDAFYSAALAGATMTGFPVDGSLHLSGRFGTGTTLLDALMTVDIHGLPLDGLIGPYSDTLTGQVGVDGNLFGTGAPLTTVHAGHLRYSGATAHLDGAFFGDSAQAVAGAWDYNRPGGLLRPEIDAAGVFAGSAVDSDPILPN